MIGNLWQGTDSGDLPENSCVRLRKLYRSVLLRFYLVGGEALACTCCSS
jgi:hypothetical protein